MLLQEIEGYPTPAMTPPNGYATPMVFQSYTQGITPEMSQGIAPSSYTHPILPADMYTFNQQMAGLGIYDPITGMMLPDLSQGAYAYSTPARYQDRSASISSSVQDVSFATSHGHNATLSPIHSRDCSVETFATSLRQSVSSSNDVRIEEVASLKGSASAGSTASDKSTPAALSKSLPGTSPISPAFSQDSGFRARSVTSEGTFRKQPADKALRIVSHDGTETSSA